MLKKKQQRELLSVNVLIRRERRPDEEPGTPEIRSFEIPEGGKCKIETIGGDFKVFYSDGLIKHHVNWQAGYTQEYEYIYRDQ